MELDAHADYRELRAKGLNETEALWLLLINEIAAVADALNHLGLGAAVEGGNLHVEVRGSIDTEP